MTYAASLSQETIEAIARRPISRASLARLMHCTDDHAYDILVGRVIPTAREAAIFRLCANVPANRLEPILRDLEDDYEWRRIPGFERYEVSVHGQVRRAEAGHGSLPGHVLRLKRDPLGYLRVNLSMDGKARSVTVHRMVCLAFNGLPPTPAHQACHLNGLHDDNRPENLYWGTATENAADRVRHAKTGTKLTQYGPPTKRQVQISFKKSMTSRLEQNG